MPSVCSSFSASEAVGLGLAGVRVHGYKTMSGTTVFTSSARARVRVCVCVCVCNPILVMTFPKWLSGTEPWPRTPGAVRTSSLCL